MGIFDLFKPKDDDIVGPIIDKVKEMFDNDPRIVRLLNKENKALRKLTNKLAKKIQPLISDIDNEVDKMAFSEILLMNQLAAKEHDSDVIFAMQYAKLKETGCVLNTILTTIVLSKLGLINEKKANIWIFGEGSYFVMAHSVLTVNTERGLLILDMSPQHGDLGPVGFIPQNCYETKQRKEGTEYVLINKSFFGNPYLDMWGETGNSHSYPLELSVFDQISLLLGTNLRGRIESGKLKL